MDESSSDTVTDSEIPEIQFHVNLFSTIEVHQLEQISATERKPITVLFIYWSESKNQQTCRVAQMSGKKSRMRYTSLPN